MAQSGKTIVIPGATGQQGFSAALNLLKKGFHVKAITRDVNSHKANLLTAAGARIMEGSFDDETVLAREFKGSYGVFCALPSQGSPNASANYTPADELRLGQKVIGAAKAASVKHFIYSSMTGLEDPSTTVGNLESKRQLEALIREVQLPATLVRPVAFMENYLFPFLYHQGRFVSFLDPSFQEPLIASEDIGVFVAQFFSDAGFIGKDRVLIGDLLDHKSIIETINRTLGVSISFTKPTDNLLKTDPILPVLANAYQWLNTWLSSYGKSLPGYLAECRSLHPRLMTFDDWVRTNGRQKLQKLLGPDQSHNGLPA